jgi:hypothetical protein
MVQKYIQYLIEKIDGLSEEKINFIRKSIRNAVIENPARLGHGETGKTGFWILPNGNTVPYTKGWKEASKYQELISVHSHSGATERLDKYESSFETFSGGDIEAHQYVRNLGKDIISVVISRDGKMEILYNGNFKKIDYRYDADSYEAKAEYMQQTGNDSSEYDREQLIKLSNERSATYLTNLNWK